MVSPKLQVIALVIGYVYLQEINKNKALLRQADFAEPFVSSQVNATAGSDGKRSSSRPRTTSICIPDKRAHLASIIKLAAGAPVGSKHDSDGSAHYYTEIDGSPPRTDGHSIHSSAITLTTTLRKRRKIACDSLSVNSRMSSMAQPRKRKNNTSSAHKDRNSSVEQPYKDKHVKRNSGRKRRSQLNIDKKSEVDASSVLIQSFLHQVASSSRIKDISISKIITITSSSQHGIKCEPHKYKDTNDTDLDTKNFTESTRKEKRSTLRSDRQETSKRKRLTSKVGATDADADNNEAFTGNKPRRKTLSISSGAVGALDSSVADNINETRKARKKREAIKQFDPDETNLETGFLTNSIRAPQHEFNGSFLIPAKRKK